MTIDSEWIVRLKEELPACFSPTPPFQPAAIFIDGQIRLMCAAWDPDSCRTWEDYTRRQFTDPIKRYLARSATRAVVLAFDDYDHVPKAKAMTQSSRRKHTPEIAFDARDQLPPTLPTGERWAQCLMNRAFKAKVITLVIWALERDLPPLLRDGQELVVDYRGHPTVYKKDLEPACLSYMPPMGESDVKFPRYLELYPSLQVDSIDGDSVPIALLAIEHLVSTRRDIPKLSVLRMQTRVLGKRAAPSQEKKKTRTYEFLDASALYLGLTDHVFPMCLGRKGVAVPALVGREMALLTALIALTGTDYTRALPNLGARSVYDMLHELVIASPLAWDPATPTPRLSPNAAADALVARIYRVKFARHLRAPHNALAPVLADILASKLGPATRRRMPTLDAVRCTIRNINWLLDYWSAAARNETYPDPLPADASYGFVPGGFAA